MTAVVTSGTSIPGSRYSADPSTGGADVFGRTGDWQTAIDDWTRWLQAGDDPDLCPHFGARPARRHRQTLRSTTVSTHIADIAALIREARALSEVSVWDRDTDDYRRRRDAYLTRKAELLEQLP